MSKILISNVFIVNEGEVSVKDILIKGKRIEKIDNHISEFNVKEIINAEGLYLFPGMIDDQVHFRQPGLTHKGTINSESKAALAGGVTSYIEMPNTIPQTITVSEYDKKRLIANKSSAANYSFMFGVTNYNYSEILKLNKDNVPGLKMFLGSSTGKMLVDDYDIINKIFRNIDLVIAAHCEDEEIINRNLEIAKNKYGSDIPVFEHPNIRSEKACYTSSSNIVELAKKSGARLHVFHVSTEKEISLFENELSLDKKKITSEACIHHMWFTDRDYESKGSFIKWNPAIKKESDKNSIIEGINNDFIDIIASDHAPHTLNEKNNSYLNCPSGGPLIQHSFMALMDLFHQKKLSLEKIVEKACHNPAILFKIKDRGFIREGYFADLVLVDLNDQYIVKKNNILYKCGWSPFEDVCFKSSIKKTMLNGQWVYLNGKIVNTNAAMELEFYK